MKEMMIAFFIVLAVSAAWKWPQDTGDAPQGGSATAPVTENPGENPLLLSATEHTFKEQVLDAKMPVLVEFYNNDDPHCKNMEPTISELATDYQASIKVVKVDVPNNPQLGQRYEIGVMPGLVIFRNGRRLQSLAGEQTKQDLAEFIQRNVPAPERAAGSAGGPGAVGGGGG
jgi:thioredoxin 1